MVLKKVSKKLRDIPTIISIRNDPKIEYKNKVVYFLMKNLYKDVDCLVLQTNEAKNFFEKIVKDNNKLHVIPNPINEKFDVNTPYVGERDKTIVTVGRLEKQKNQKLLIDAFKIASEKHNDYKLLLYGKGSLQKQLEEHCENNSLEDKVIFKGQVDNVKEEIYKAGMFVLSSDYEGMPNALMEAMALGLPCISTDCPCGGPRTLIQQNENGILVETNNVEQLSNAINMLIENRELSSKIGYSANKIKESYSVNVIAKKWLNVIESMVNL